MNNPGQSNKIPSQQKQQQQGQGQQQPPIMQQPNFTPPAGSSSGLEYLAQLDQLIVKQQIEVLEIISGFETQNKYKIMNAMGEDVFFAKEESTCCSRWWCGSIRNFEMAICDNSGHEVIHLDRPYRCQGCLCFCCLQEMEVSAPPGNSIGTIEQNWTLIYPKFTLKDEHGLPVMKISGPWCTWSCGKKDVVFQVKTLDGEEVGKICKRWSGFAKEMVTDADNFVVTFPQSLDVKKKALLLGACFLIDFMYFEDRSNGLLDCIA